MMKKYLLYIKKGLLWSIATVLLIPFIHYVLVHSWYDWSWYIIAVPIFILLGGPLFTLLLEQMMQQKKR